MRSAALIAAMVLSVAVPAIGKATAKEPSPLPATKASTLPDSVAALKKAMKAVEGPVAVGQTVADFTLKDTEGKTHTLSDYLAQGKVVILEWFNPDCPFVKKHHALTTSMHDTQALAAKNGIVWLAVNSGAPGKQGNGLERNKTARAEYKMDYPVLLDENGTVGMLYGSKNTPTMFLISPQGTLLYHGAIDSDNTPQTLGETNYVKKAIEEYMAGKPITTPETKPYGCSVKYAT